MPEPDLGSVPLTVTVPWHEEVLLEFVNSWVEEQRASGLVDAKVEYWIRGKGAEVERGPRWSVARDVVGWWQ